MPKKNKPSPAADDDKLDGFAQQVEQALEHYTEPEWLGANSVLAAPFVLAWTIDPANQGETFAERGKVLQEVLRVASKQLDVELITFVTDLYFQRNKQINNVARAMKRSMSERTFYRRRHQAIQALANALYELLLPPLRVERPLVRSLAGRTQLLQSCLVALAARQSIHLSGPSGVGKTVVGARIMTLWPHTGFWFTVRTGLTDRFASFVFAFAYYLRSRGASHTWRQLLADNGVVQIDSV